ADRLVPVADLLRQARSAPELARLLQQGEGLVLPARRFPGTRSVARTFQELEPSGLGHRLGFLGGPLQLPLAQRARLGVEAELLEEAERLRRRQRLEQLRRLLALLRLDEEERRTELVAALHQPIDLERAHPVDRRHVTCPLVGLARRAQLSGAL